LTANSQDIANHLRSYLRGNVLQQLQTETTHQDALSALLIFCIVNGLDVVAYNDQKRRKIGTFARNMNKEQELELLPIKRERAATIKTAMYARDAFKSTVLPDWVLGQLCSLKLFNDQACMLVILLE